MTVQILTINKLEEGNRIPPRELLDRNLLSIKAETEGLPQKDDAQTELRNFYRNLPTKTRPELITNDMDQTILCVCLDCKERFWADERDVRYRDNYYRKIKLSCPFCGDKK